MDGQGALIAGRYRLRSRVGAGGMGVVWEAWDERLHRAVAVKLLHRAAGLDEAQANVANLRVMREARITARLHHRYAVPVFDVVEHEGQACLVMPFLSSMTLAAVLREGGPLSIAEVEQVGAQIASALAAAHQVGIVHRDVKPRNILITEDGTALICDFGISHAFGEATLTAAGLVHGTPAYLAPEVARGGEATYASDVFSLGATLYDALEGAPPFGTDQNSIALLHRIAAGHVEPPRRGGRLTPILLRTLDADPGSRPSMAAVAEALSGLTRATDGPIAPIGQAVSEPGASAVTPNEGSTTTPPRPAADPVPLTGAAAEIADPEPPQSETTAAPSGSQPSRTAPSRRRSRVRVWSLAGAVLLVGGAIVALLLHQFRPQDHVTAGGQSASSSKPTSVPTVTRATSPASKPSRSPVSTGSPTTAPSSSPSHRTPSPSHRTPSPQPPVRGTPTARDLSRAITSYYALVPNHTDEAWPRMTAAYQSDHAGGRTGYENFWRPVRRVTVDEVSGRPPNRAVATIAYYYRDGRVVRERTAYRLVNHGGVLKIADSRVLSSATS